MANSENVENNKSGSGSDKLGKSGTLAGAGSETGKRLDQDTERNTGQGKARPLKDRLDIDKEKINK